MNNEKYNSNPNRTSKRRKTLAIGAAVSTIVGVANLASSEGIPCDPVIDNGCVTTPENPTLPTLPDKEVKEEVSTTTVPETTVPKTTVPETTVPETTVPETTGPKTTVPETTGPKTTVPEETTTTTYQSNPPGMPPITIVVNESSPESEQEKL